MFSHSRRGARKSSARRLGRSRPRRNRSPGLRHQFQARGRGRSGTCFAAPGRGGAGRAQGISPPPTCGNQLHGVRLILPRTVAADAGDSSSCELATSPFGRHKARYSHANNRTAPPDRDPRDKVNQCDGANSYHKPSDLWREAYPFLICHCRNLGESLQSKL